MNNKCKIVNTTYQQGDVLLRKLGKLPAGEIKIEARNRVVLAHGESGHSHVVEDDEAELIRVGERILLRLGRATTVQHEEHNAPTSLLPEPIQLAPGIWEVGRVQEYDWLEKMVRPVVD
jgi:hypothetical protein